MAVRYGVLLSIVLLESIRSPAQKESEWTVHNEMQNRIYTGSALFTSSTNTEISCVIACAQCPCCLFVTYTSSSGSCRGHNEVFNSISNYTYCEGTTAYYTRGRQVMKYTHLEDGQLCISIKMEAKKWTEAAESCQAEGTDLLILDTLEKQHAISTYLNEHSVYGTKFWIGGSDLDVEGKWVWVDGTEMPMTNDFWHTDEPNNCCGGEDCVVLSELTERTWNDGKCISGKHYICGFEV